MQGFIYGIGAMVALMFVGAMVWLALVAAAKRDASGLHGPMSIPASSPPSVELGDYTETSEQFKKLQGVIREGSTKQLQALDAIVFEVSKLRKAQEEFVRTIFSGGSISTGDDEAGAREEKIQAIMRRYGATREEASARIDGADPYQPSRGAMGGQV